jgi:hypothetical protein
MAKQPMNPYDLIGVIIDQLTPKSAREWRTSVYAGMTPAQLAQVISVRAEKLAKRHGVNLNLIEKAVFDDAATELRTLADEVVTGAKPAATAGGLSGQALGPQATRATPPVPTTETVKIPPTTPSSASPKPHSYGLNRPSLGKVTLGKKDAARAAAMFTTGTATQMGGQRTAGKLRSLFAPTKAAAAASTIPGVVTEKWETARAGRGARLPKLDVAARRKEIFGRAAKTRRWFGIPKSSLGKLGLGLGVTYGVGMVGDIAEQVSGRAEEREIEQEQRLRDFQTLQERVAAGILTTEDVRRKQRLQDQVDFQAMMIRQKDPSLAQLMMGLPETTSSEFIIGAQPNIRQFRDTIRQQILQKEVREAGTEPPPPPPAPRVEADEAAAMTEAPISGTEPVPELQP